MALNRRQIRTRRNVGLALVALIAGLVALYYLVTWRTYDRYAVETDNAFVTGNLIPVYADATGVVTQVLAEETQNVKTGDVLIRLDEQRAGALLAQAEADLARAVRNVSALFENRRQSCEKINSRLALRDRLRHDLARYQQAAPSGSVSQQALQNARDQLASAEADVREARADTQSIEARIVGVTRTNHPDILAAQAKYLDAYIEFARQHIKAPASGYVAKRKAQVGDRVKPGDQIMTIVPLDHLWVEANLWENAMQRVRPGQNAQIVVDLYGGKTVYHGRVEGLVPGSGSVFALLPPDNATGNFIHIVQRVPVRISLRADELAKDPLRPGLSTVTTIDVRDDQTPVDASQVSTSSAEYRTNIYDDDLAQGKAKAEEIVKQNLAGKGGEGERACAIGE
ncbi:MAG TPA: efflux RND transporter periplasmic adaptor subunit [Methylocystis sp.]|nr:efflux RND transporter periplasmic adaptor subunit [Methylocystis sp.]